MQKTGMAKISTLFLLLALSISTSLSAQSTDDDPGEPDTLWVDSIAAFTNQSGIVPVYFFNDEVLSGLSMALSDNAFGVKIDSFSFLGGRLASASTRNVVIGNDSNIVVVAVFDEIPPGTGLLGHLYYRWPNGITPQLVTIDSVYRLEGSIEWATRFSTDMTFIEFIPQFRRGYIDIQSPPPELDSIWLVDMVGERNKSLPMDIYFYNEAPVVGIQVALDYGSSDLHYDSVSFEGLRDLPPFDPAPTVQDQPTLHELLLNLTFDEATPLDSGSGIIARLHFTVDPGAIQDTFEVTGTEFADVAPTTVTRAENVGGKVFIPIVHAATVEINVSTDVEIVDTDDIPASYTLAQNYPNPFNPSTQIQFSIPRSSHVRMDVFNILGRRVQTLVDQWLPAGVHEVTFDGRSDSGGELATGIYFYRMETGDFIETRKMLLIK
jgi:hypothetical protein